LLCIHWSNKGEAKSCCEQRKLERFHRESKYQLGA
jgi:hypothetical protein